ncbi:MAG: heavy metal-binding domain-containing protein, partial [Gammaproteobacteria bacterium]|nr:heavy metal-binding domain-containing protein [Gammaproteobacteria bacterium]
IGGEIVGYPEMLADARDIAIERMVDEANKRGADAIINIRFTTSAIMANASEILAYGTAVKLTDPS